MKKAFLDTCQLEFEKLREISMWLGRNLRPNTYRCRIGSHDAMAGYEFDDEADLIILKLALGI